MELNPVKTDILYIYRKLVSCFSKIDGFSGWMIAKAEFKIEEATGIIDKTGLTATIPVKSKFVKQRKNYSVISACAIYKNMEYTVIMHIVKPDNTHNQKLDCADMADIAPEKPCPGFDYLFTLKYTIEDIKSFTEYTGDSNPVHQTAKPVVPGFLVFGDIIKKELYKYAVSSKIKFIIFFRNPLFADEPAEVYKSSGDGKIIALQTCGQNNIIKKQKIYFNCNMEENLWKKHI